jgi:hypothetical protein
MLGPNVAHCDIPTLKLGPNSEFGSHIEGRLSLSDPPRPLPPPAPQGSMHRTQSQKQKRKKPDLKHFAVFFFLNIPNCEEKVYYLTS